MLQPSGRSRSIGHYILSKTIGQGTFGKVKLGSHILTGQKVAVKILEKAKIVDRKDVQRVSREIKILKQVRHPNIVQLYEIIQTPKQLYLIMEYASGGELFDYIVQNQKLGQRQACFFFQQILQGVKYLHTLGVVHRDLKPENLLLSHQKHIKIVDFGLSNLFTGSEKLKTACGSPCYAAPEMVAGKRYEPTKTDIWSCGIILFACICGYLPFQDTSTSLLYKKIISGEYRTPKFLTEEAKDILEKILNTDPQKRFSIQQISQHPWYKLVNQIIPRGILIGVDIIPVNNNVLDQLNLFGFDKEEAKNALETNKHTHLTTTYYLLFNKHKQAEEQKKPPRAQSKSPMRPKTNQKRVVQTTRKVNSNQSSGKNTPKSTTPNSSPRRYVKPRAPFISSPQNKRPIKGKAVFSRTLPSPSTPPPKSTLLPHRGPYNISSLSTLPLPNLVQKLQSALKQSKIPYTKAPHYKYETKTFSVQIKSIQAALLVDLTLLDRNPNLEFFASFLKTIQMVKLSLQKLHFSISSIFLSSHKIWRVLNTEKLYLASPSLLFVY